MNRRDVLKATAGLDDPIDSLKAEKIIIGDHEEISRERLMQLSQPVLFVKNQDGKITLFGGVGTP